MRKVSKNFYLVSWAAGGIALLSLYLTGWIAGIRRGWEAWQAATSLGVLPGIYLAVVWLVLLHKAWASIQDGQTSVSPGKAVGFLFIPFYNFYWIFRAVWVSPGSSTPILNGTPSPSPGSRRACSWFPGAAKKSGRVFGS
jgi:hypothetical protein